MLKLRPIAVKFIIGICTCGEKALLTIVELSHKIGCARVHNDIRLENIIACYSASLTLRQSSCDGARDSCESNDNLGQLEEHNKRGL
jgi:hypothetical protein